MKKNPNFEGFFFNENHPYTRHIKYKRVDSLLVTNQLWQISFLQPIWNDF